MQIFLSKSSPRNFPQKKSTPRNYIWDSLTIIMFFLVER